MVFDIGASATHIVAVHEGFALPHTLQRLPLGGEDQTQFLQAIFSDRGVELDLNVAEALKRSKAMVATDFVTESAHRRAKIIDVPKSNGHTSSSNKTFANTAALPMDQTAETTSYNMNNLGTLNDSNAISVIFCRVSSGATTESISINGCVFEARCTCL